MSTENEGPGRPDGPADGAPEPAARPGGEGLTGAAPAAGPPVPSAPPGPPPGQPQTLAGPPPVAPGYPAPAAHRPAGPPPAGPSQAATEGAGIPAPPPAAVPPPAVGAPAAGYGGPPAATGSWAFPPQPAPPQPKRRRNGLLIGVAVATLIAGGVGGGVGYWAADAGSDDSAVGLSSGSGAPAREPESVAGIAEAALPSVVTIEAASGSESAGGTGFVYDEAGHIMTNNHVVAAAADGGEVSVTFSDGQSYEAEVLGHAEGYDVAVMRLLDADDRDLEPLPLGDSDAVAVGDATIAIGAPFGLSGTVTTGIVSAKDRPVASSDGQSGNASYMNALQTDASINPGNSGGPLLNANGEVIGVNSAIRSTTGGLGGEAGSVGLGFAIPINQASRVASDLMERGEAVYPIIGASVDSGSGGQEGARIVDATNDSSDPVTPGGPADAAGLQPGDVITRFGDRVIDSSPTLISQIWTYQPGESVEVTYLRDGREETTTIVLGQRVGE
ncbi:trypsin-like peptidase domain-containing protein [Streptomyces sp. DSM 44915]|uniref:Trypsin-like peptidase domain-containing protein n=1 Tax=Streptomyces chisholmiae TaxID=3075540 RepID=A0ABU2JQC9_9ACTN|nr:trypsin-like peptidase domain-containing protein [Streptomyces sp. DSM 44915]MDT0267183.1 trypsin-like peptidase domain-containing protein [Streptomyces sp. DSM 44915]